MLINLIKGGGGCQRSISLLYVYFLQRRKPGMKNIVHIIQKIHTNIVRPQFKSQGYKISNFHNVYLPKITQNHLQ